LPRPLPPDIPGLTRVTTLLANAWLVDAPGGFVLVDTGLPGYAGRIVRHAERRYGAHARPHAIVLTHGHLDHAGSAARLSRLWDVPVFAHRRELPFLDGRASYPAPDPESGPLAALARSLPPAGADLRARLRPLPLDGRVPCLPGWRWLRTPGATPGHVSLFRPRDRTLLAGDALGTIGRRLALPPTPFAADRRAGRASLLALASLRPVAVAAGHGSPMTGGALAAQLRAVAGISPQEGPARRAAAWTLVALGAGLAFGSIRRVAHA
jgi:glyoxylase-like metal-dependent hydrolase (beta-lactamase superfamily II)